MAHVPRPGKYNDCYEGKKDKSRSEQFFGFWWRAFESSVWPPITCALTNWNHAFCRGPYRLYMGF